MVVVVGGGVVVAAVIDRFVEVPFLVERSRLFL
jgi:hypothetical protein